MMNVYVPYSFILHSRTLIRSNEKVGLNGDSSPALCHAKNAVLYQLSSHRVQLGAGCQAHRRCSLV